jgi:hypothetical protein
VKLPRLSIAKMMIFVVVIALDFAIIRALAAYNPFLPVAVALIGFALQAGVFVRFHSQGRRRAFLTGFLAFGTMAMTTAIWAIVFAPNIGIAHDPSTGETITRIIPGSAMWSLWSGYVEFIATFLGEHLDVAFDLMDILPFLIWSLPQFLIALSGGFLTGLIAGWRNNQPLQASAIPTAVGGRAPAGESFVT